MRTSSGGGSRDLYPGFLPSAVLLGRGCRQSLHARPSGARLGRPHATGVGSIHVERSCAALDGLLRDQHFIDTIEAW